MSRRPVGIIVVSVLMGGFGIAEVVTAFRHTFFGLSTSQSVAATVAGAAVGLLYVAAGVLAFTLRRSGLIAALVCLGFDVVGRLVMVVAGYYPVTTERQLASIVAGTLVVATFGGYLLARRNRFSSGTASR